MIELIPIINKLQDVFNAIGKSPIDLPQIVVIGSQSSGKSSVLEKIVGRDFLPRGTGVVTRRPLVLQLYNHPAKTQNAGNTYKEGQVELGCKDKSPNGEEWGEFLHLPGQVFHNFNDIRLEIERETERLTGSNKGISNQSINLKIYSPNVLNLTLVDLPGITKVPVGDQPIDIEDQIREMCLRFISNPNSIILAVTAANTDLANSDALKMARSVDNEGIRTIGVLTKLDLMDQGTDALDMLQGRIIPLKRGFVGVINRSQADIANNISIKEILRKESQFFATHASYRSMADRLGTPYLAKMLNTILLHHIRDCLPDIKARISGMLSDLDAEMIEMGEPTSAMSKTDMGATLLNILSHFATNFNGSIEGRQCNRDGVDMLELYGGARVNYIFNEIFTKSVLETNPFDDLSDEDIRTAIRNANGPRQSLFVPEVSFELLAKRQIARLEQPGLQCVELVFDELQRITLQCNNRELSRFAELNDRLYEVVNKLLRSCLAPTQEMISNLIKIELSYINTNHPDFIGGSRAVANLMDRLHREAGPETEAGKSTSNARHGSGASMGNSADANGKRSSGSGSRNPFEGNVTSTDSETTKQKDEGNEDDPDRTGSQGSLMSFIFPGKKGRSDSSSDVNDPTRGHSSLNDQIVHRATVHGDNGGSVIKLPQVPMTMRSVHEPTEREHIETEIIKSLLESYFDIVRKNFLDMVPKTIMCFLVNKSKESMQNYLVSHLYKEDMLLELLSESGDIASRRENCYEMRTLLKRAIEIVNEVRDYNTFK